MVEKAQKSHGARSGLYGGCSNGVSEHRTQFTSRPMRFLGFSKHDKGAPRQEVSKRSTVCSTSSRNGWSVVRSASLARGGTSKKRPLECDSLFSNMASAPCFSFLGFTYKPLDVLEQMIRCPMLVAIKSKDSFWLLIHEGSRMLQRMTRHLYTVPKCGECCNGAPRIQVCRTARVSTEAVGELHMFSSTAHVTAFPHGSC
jgi:hypothetical protein